MVETTHIPSDGTVDPAEVERFSRIADEWWDPAGKFAPLHRLNPVRIGYVRDRIAAHWGRDALNGEPLQGLSLLDIGCGGGLLSEPMCRLGASVTGVDASDRNIATASIHAARQDLAIDYRQGTAEALAGSGAQFDVVLALEIVEHVADVDLFLASCGRMVKPGGLLFLAGCRAAPTTGRSSSSLPRSRAACAPAESSRRRSSASSMPRSAANGR